MVLKLAEIYETKAQSHLGLYYQSEDINDLDRAERSLKTFPRTCTEKQSGTFTRTGGFRVGQTRQTRERME